MESTEKLVKLISEFSKVIGYKINIQNSVLFLFITNEQSEIEIKNYSKKQHKRYEILGDKPVKICERPPQ